jgi:hypothetical protein
MSLAIDHGPARQFRSDNRLSRAEIADIENDLRQWSKPKITWNAVVTRVEALVGRRFSRQALEAHPAIYRAYVDAKKRLRNGLPPAKRKPLAERVAALQAENEELREQNRALLEQFVTWLSNAQSYGLRPDQLNAPLPTARLPSDFRERVLKEREKKRARLKAQQEKRLSRKRTRQ